VLITRPSTSTGRISCKSSLNARCIIPRSPAPQWRKRKEPVLDAHLQASLDQAHGTYDENGHYALLVYAGCPTRERAKEIVQALHRSANHLGVSVSTKTIKAEDGSFQIHFKAIDKIFAKRYVLQKYGNDVSKWPYNPRNKGGG
jgi:glutathionyl-hydroquinone reductase